MIPPNGGTTYFDCGIGNPGAPGHDKALFGINPHSAASIYRPSLTRTEPGTDAGRRYTVERSENLSLWAPVSVQSGTGAVITLPISPTMALPFYHVIVACE